MIPAMRATAMTSPFLLRPSVSASSVSGRIFTEPSARALRLDAALLPTSTMCAAPVSSRCVRRFAIGASSRAGVVDGGAPVRGRPARTAIERIGRIPLVVDALEAKVAAVDQQQPAHEARAHPGGFLDDL